MVAPEGLATKAVIDVPLALTIVGLGIVILAAPVVNPRTSTNPRPLANNVRQGDNR
jgi:hypothetical protein